MYHRVVIDDFDLPGEWPDLRVRLGERTTEDMFAELSERDPDAAAKIEPENRRRVIRALEVTLGSGRPFSSFGPGVDHYPEGAVPQIGLRWPRETIGVRIEQRVHRMIEAGLVGEVRQLCAAGLSKTAGQALGYKEMKMHIDGEISEDAAIEMIITRTRQFAVRQERWFRRDPRIRWIDVEHDAVSEVAPVVVEQLEMLS